LTQTRSSSEPPGTEIGLVTSAEAYNVVVTYRNNTGTCPVLSTDS